VTLGVNLDELKRFASSKRIPLGTTEKDYVLTVALMQLSKSRYARQFIFKGGTAIKKVYFPEARFSEDLDFNFFDIPNDELVAEILKLFSGRAILEVGFKEIKDKEIADNKVSLRLQYMAQLSHSNSVWLHFHSGEPTLLTPDWWKPKDDYDIARRMTCEHLNFGMLGSGFPNYSCKLGRFWAFGDSRKTCLDCRMEAPRRSEPIPSAFRAMSLEEILAEKVRACIVRGRPRDLWDIWFLQSKGIRLDYGMIVDKLRRYEQFRELIPSLGEIREKLDRIEPEWDRDLGVLVPTKPYPTFQETMENVVNSLRTCGWKE